MSGCQMYSCASNCPGYPHDCEKCGFHEGAVADIRWHRAKAGHAFGKEAIVIYDGDPDPRLVKCAIYDCKYILVEDLKKLPADETE